MSTEPKLLDVSRMKIYRDSLGVGPVMTFPGESWGTNDMAEFFLELLGDHPHEDGSEHPGHIAEAWILRNDFHALSLEFSHEKEPGTFYTPHGGQHLLLERANITGARWQITEDEEDLEAEEISLGSKEDLDALAWRVVEWLNASTDPAWPSRQARRSWERNFRGALEK